ncbi:outer membrane beta-barrel family protein [Chitinophaga niabensis]|uniref:Outer membrane receptor proteins, mostly Fe transport n=1 Tax=Chitinophaga niabensis TaxID=536979 RepID=A0A1N6D949_9BACT|nr:outer membrane beta-barrel family protein [Chitinophaga niabensis]SIN67320.1 Outer membrane receptor proteins, mostly Fe transport [Chitinophaga niabensis]
MKKLYAVFIALMVMQLNVAAQAPQNSGRPGAGTGAGQRPGGAGGPGGPGGGAMPQIGQIYGKLVDAQTKQAVEYASVALLRAKDSSVVTGMLSKGNGDFNLENLPFGAFLVRINFMGYKTIFKRVTVTPQTMSQDLGNIKLEANAKSLEEVNVTGQRSAFQMSIDKKVFNVDRNLTSVGGTAADVLKSVPSVNVDIDGNVKVRNSSPNIFVDGKPSTLSIDQIPADAIESVELITNPSAKYDAEGMSGIINIVLKKNKKAGYNGMVMAGIGNNDKYNLGGNVNVRQGKWNVSANYNFNANRNWGNGTTDRTNFAVAGSPDQNYINQNSDSRQGGQFQFGRFGLDYFLDNRNTLSLSQNIVGGSFKNRETLASVYSDANKAITNRNNRYTDSKFGFNNYTTTLGFKHLFAEPNRELTADVSLNLSNNNRSGGFITQPLNLSGDPVGNRFAQSNNSDGKTNFYSFQADYVDPVGKTGKFETGIKGTMRYYSSVYDVFDATNGNPVRIDSISNDYKYDEQIYAAYANYSNTIQNFGYQVGLRAEQYVYAGEIPSKSLKYKPTKPVPGLFPSVYLSYKLKKEQEVQLNYSRRVNRPNFFQLIPYRDFTDPLNHREGNPDLKPEYTNSLEFSYMKTWKKHNFLGSLYYRNTNNLISTINEPITPGNDTLLTTFVNANKNFSYGAELTMKNEIITGWSITTNVNLYQTELQVKNAKENYTNRGFSWLAKINSETKLPANFTFQVTANYQAPTITVPSGGGGGGRGGGGGGGGFMMIPTSAQGMIKGLSAVDLAVRKDFLKNKAASLTLSLSDVFNTRQFEMDQESPYFSQNFIRKRESRILKLNFSYRFGKFDATLFKRKNNKSSADGMQMDTGGGF